MHHDTHWNARFLALAQHISTWSKDPSTKVGAIIVRPDRTIASVGYNGFPRGVFDTDVALADRPTKYARTVHAEVNAILSAKEPLDGYGIYVFPLHPCASCAGIIIQSGIRRVTAYMGETPDRWDESFRQAEMMFNQAGVSVEIIKEWGAQ